MSIIDWNDGLELGNRKIDEHHKHLVTLINKTYDDYIGNKNRNDFEQTLDDLIYYTIYHFAAEEYWMRVNKYPKRLQHRDEHDKFSKKFVEIQKDIHKGKMNLSIEIMHFIKCWLLNHILITDADYTCFAKKVSQQTSYSDFN